MTESELVAAILDYCAARRAIQPDDRDADHQRITFNTVEAMVTDALYSEDHIELSDERIAEIQAAMYAPAGGGQ